MPSAGSSADLKLRLRPSGAFGRSFFRLTCCYSRRLAAAKAWFHMTIEVMAFLVVGH